MILTGLVSITFRKLLQEEIIKLVKKAGLDGIEWGGDIHVPHGDTRHATDVQRMTKEAGLKVAAYGSYYKVGCEEKGICFFRQVLDTAVALGAPAIRVWAGNCGSKEIDRASWLRIVQESKEIASLAEKEGIKIAYEFHSNTLTDTGESAEKLLREVNHRNVYSYWQPPNDMTTESCLETLDMIKPWLSNIHAYYWVSDCMKPLVEGRKEWSIYLENISKVPGNRYVMLEFVKNDTPEQFIQDAETLKGLCMAFT